MPVVRLNPDMAMLAGAYHDGRAATRASIEKWISENYQILAGCGRKKSGTDVPRSAIPIA
jgi:hypothetical protein